MKKYDVVLLTDSRYVNPEQTDPYIENVLKEDGLVEEALKELGIKTIKKDWNDHHFEWNTTKLALFRTTWDYFDKYPIFEKWLDNIQNKCLLLNTFDQIKWNLDKHYLLDLDKKGIPIPKSIFIPQNSEVFLSKICQEQNWNEIVIKPTISGAARHTYRLKLNELEDFQLKWTSLIKNEDFIIQEFQKNVLTKGEVALMLFGGKFTHSIMKKAKKGDFRVQDDFGGSVEIYSPDNEMIELSEKVVQQLDPIPAYARVDVIWNNNSQIVVSELELIEPELWFRYNESAAKMLAKSVKDFIKKYDR